MVNQLAYFAPNMIGFCVFLLLFLNGGIFSQISRADNIETIWMITFLILSVLRSYYVVSIFISTKEVMFSLGFVCAFVNKLTPKLVGGF